MIFIEFPITGPYRTYLILMEWIFIFLCFELSLIFFMRYFESKKTAKNIQEFSYGSLVLSYGIQWIWYIFSDYYAPTPEIRMYFLALGYLTVILGAFVFILSMEIDYKFYIKYLFSLIFLIIIIIFLILAFMDLSTTQNFSYIPTAFFVLFFIFYIRNFAKRASIKKKAGILFVKYFIGFLTLGIGFMFTTDWATSFLGIESKLLGDFIQIIAILIIYVFFSSLPPLSEFDWYDKIESIFLMNKSGLCIYSKYFHGDGKKWDEHLVSGAVMGVDTMLEQMTLKKGVSVIKKDEQTTIIYPGKYLTGVIFCREDLSSLKSLLKVFTKKIELVYSTIIESWEGEIRDLSIFEPVENISKSIFKKI